MSEIEKYYNGTMHVDFEEEDLISEIIEQHNEIERLNKLIDYKGIEDIPQYIEDLEVDNKSLKQENKILNSIIKEVREYITSYESIETIQQCEHSENNKGLDEKTMIEMDRRYLIVHDKILDILDKENKND